MVLSHLFYICIRCGECSTEPEVSTFCKHTIYANPLEHQLAWLILYQGHMTLSGNWVHTAVSLAGGPRIISQQSRGVRRCRPQPRLRASVCSWLIWERENRPRAKHPDPHPLPLLRRSKGVILNQACGGKQLKASHTFANHKNTHLLIKMCGRFRGCLNL